MITSFKKENIWDFITYIDSNFPEQTERWRLKAFNNSTQTAYIVFRCNDKWGQFQNYTWESCKYDNLAIN